MDVPRPIENGSDQQISTDATATEQNQSMEVDPPAANVPGTNAPASTSDSSNEASSAAEGTLTSASATEPTAVDMEVDSIKTDMAPPIENGSTQHSVDATPLAAEIVSYIILITMLVPSLAHLER
jgi:hypothetical protein